MTFHITPSARRDHAKRIRTQERKARATRLLVRVALVSVVAGVLGSFGSWYLAPPAAMLITAVFEA